MAALRLGVLGGTFDPPHNAHMALGRHAREQLGLEKVLFVPAADQWRKPGTAISPAKHRIAMLRLALEGGAGVDVSTVDVDREGPTYTVDTLEALQNQYPESKLVFLLGADALLDLPNWYHAADLPRLALLGVADRGGDRPDIGTLEDLVPGVSQRVTWFNMPRMDVSATEIRERVAAGLGIGELVPAAVEDYIHRHKLYSPV